MPDQVVVPRAVLVKVRRALDAVQEVEDALEGLLIAQDPRILARLRRARCDHTAGRTRALDVALGEP